jgi:hypothetical protein
MRAVFRWEDAGEQGSVRRERQEAAEKHLRSVVPSFWIESISERYSKFDAIESNLAVSKTSTTTFQSTIGTSRTSRESAA